MEGVLVRKQSSINSISLNAFLGVQKGLISRIVKANLNKNSNLLSIKDVDIGFVAGRALLKTKPPQPKKILIEFRNDARAILKVMV